MIIESANFDNYQDYHKTYIQALREGFVDFVPNQWIDKFDSEFFEYFGEEYKDTLTEMYICYANDVPIGTICLSHYTHPQTNQKCALLDSIYFRKSVHGLGYAKVALDFLESRARVLGYECMVLWCSIQNKRAWSFYIKNGYIPTDQEWDDVLDGHTFNNILYFLR